MLVDVITAELQMLLFSSRLTQANSLPLILFAGTHSFNNAGRQENEGMPVCEPTPLHVCEVSFCACVGFICWHLGACEAKTEQRGDGRSGREGGKEGAEVNRANQHFDLKTRSLCAVMNNFVPKH